MSANVPKTSAGWPVPKTGIPPPVKVFQSKTSVPARMPKSHHGVQDMTGREIYRATRPASDKNLLATGWLSDCKVVCGKKEWLTHKSILCSRSHWFELAFDGRFMEASTGVVFFEEMQTWQIQWVLDFIYGSELPELTKPSEIIDLHVIGDFVRLASLTEHAEATLKTVLEKILTSVATGQLRLLGHLIAAGASHAFETVACPLSFRTLLLDALCDPRLANYRNSPGSSILSPEFKGILRRLPNEAMVSLLGRLYRNGKGVMYDEVEEHEDTRPLKKTVPINGEQPAILQAKPALAITGTAREGQALSDWFSGVFGSECKKNQVQAQANARRDALRAQARARALGFEYPLSADL